MRSGFLSRLSSPLWFVLLIGCAGAPAVTVLQADLCVYGATSAGVIAAVQGANDGLRVVLLEPSRHLGGLSSAGLGATDVGSQAAIGGLSREFYRRVARHYAADTAWRWQARAEFRGHGHPAGADAAWTFEPHVARDIFAAMLAEAGVEPRMAERLVRPGGVRRDGDRIRSVRLESGLVVEADSWIDATYEGDLMAEAGVTYTVGREANAVYGETLNGVQVDNARHHQFQVAVDPWLVPGDPTSGLLPGVSPDGPGRQGDGDRKVQAYCFRICATDIAENRLPWPRPADYDESEFELLLRWFEAGATMAPWHPLWMPNRKTDANNNGAVSTDCIGANWDYPEAGYAERERIVQAHVRYQQGLLWTLANHPRVPAAVRAEFARFGLCRDEFQATGGWPAMLYIREARRMVGELVTTEHHCMGREVAPDPVGMGAYSMDSHNVQRYVDAAGHVRNEGDVQVRVPAPYGISYRSLVPRRGECSNLWVPVCAAASHIAYGSLRMEPVFMVLGQSAAVAAAMARSGGVAAQDVPYPPLAERLRQLDQVLGLPADDRR